MFVIGLAAIQDSVTLRNDLTDTIRLTELTASINYYCYQDSTVYSQTFYTSEALPSEILAEQSETYQIPISLPVNIAGGYINPVIEAKTDRWIVQELRWRVSERATDANLKFFVESPSTATSNTLLLAFAAVLWAGAVAFVGFLVYTRKARLTPHS